MNYLGIATGRAKQGCVSKTGKLGYRAIGLGVRTPARFEVFRQQCRTIHEIKRNAIDVVFDVGANVGFYAKHLRTLGFRGTIVRAGSRHICPIGDDGEGRPQLADVIVRREGA